MVKYSFANNYDGLRNYTSKFNQLIKGGKFEIYSDEYLKLRSSSGYNKLKNLGTNNYCRLHDGISTCELDRSTTINLDQSFTFF